MRLEVYREPFMMLSIIGDSHVTVDALIAEFQWKIDDIWYAPYVQYDCCHDENE